MTAIVPSRQAAPRDQAEPPLRQVLRHATARAHKHAERAAGLSAHVTDRASVENFLARLHGFQAAAEAWLLDSPLDQDFLRSRQRAPLMARDLDRLGVVDRPRYIGAFGTPDMASAMGTLYVIEGARLGGRHIDGWLSRTDWYPAAGFECLRSAHDMQLWYETCEALDALDAGDHGAVVAAAQTTFTMLAVWFERPL